MLSEEDLQAELDRRQEAKKREAIKAKENYETDRDKLVGSMINQALYINSVMGAFKGEAISRLDDFYERAKAYGDIRSTSKGGFSLRTSDGKFKVSYDRNTMVEYDERADLAEQQLREFLQHMVKKRDEKAYEIITTLLERGKSGQFNPIAINQLIKMEDKFNDPRWVKAVQLFKESHAVHLISYSVSFYVKNEDSGKDELVRLSLPSIPIIRDTDDGKDNAIGAD
ncbi:DUF3164 family protein [Labilibaculum manganireducens]|nr:DUF3164 family protein [Labilibaculum manganireducens]